MDYGWPGNAGNSSLPLERAILLCEGDMIIPDDLPDRSPAGIAGRGLRVAFQITAEGFRFEEGKRNLILQGYGNQRTTTSPRPRSCSVYFSHAAKYRLEEVWDLRGGRGKKKRTNRG